MDNLTKGGTLMLNTVILAGNLGNDPESFFSSDGETHIVTFSLAFVSGFKDGKEKVSWIKTTCFGKVADLAEKYLHKGARIALTGTLEEQKWETEEKEKRSAIKLIARDIEFIKIDDRGGEESQL